MSTVIERYRILFENALDIEDMVPRANSGKEENVILENWL